jgi:hypothetical protein
MPLAVYNTRLSSTTSAVILSKYRAPGTYFHSHKAIKWKWNGSQNAVSVVGSLVTRNYLEFWALCQSNRWHWTGGTGGTSEHWRLLTRGKAATTRSWQLHLVQRLRLRGDMPSLPILLNCANRDNFTFTLKFFCVFSRIEWVRTIWLYPLSHFFKATTFGNSPCYHQANRNSLCCVTRWGTRYLVFESISEWNFVNLIK